MLILTFASCSPRLVLSFGIEAAFDIRFRESSFRFREAGARVLLMVSPRKDAIFSSGAAEVI